MYVSSTNGKTNLNLVERDLFYTTHQLSHYLVVLSASIKCMWLYFFDTYSTTAFLQTNIYITFGYTHTYIIT